MQAEAAIANGFQYGDTNHPGKHSGIIYQTPLTLFPHFEYFQALQDAMHIVLNQGEPVCFEQAVLHKWLHDKLINSADL